MMDDGAGAEQIFEDGAQATVTAPAFAGGDDGDLAPVAAYGHGPGVAQTAGDDGRGLCGQGQRGAVGGRQQQARAALGLLQKIGEDPPYFTAIALSILALVARDRGQFDTAIACLDQAPGARRRTKDERLVAGALPDLGEAYRLVQRPQEALRCYEEAAQLWAGSGDLLEQIKLQYDIGVLHFSQDAWGEASALFEEALALLDEFPDHVRAAPARAVSTGEGEAGSRLASGQAFVACPPDHRFPV